jgi:hypothetical protein
MESLSGVVGHDLGGARVGQQVALTQRVGRMPLPRVTRPRSSTRDRWRSLGTTESGNSVDIVSRAPEYRDDRDTGLGDLDGRSEA